MWFGFFVCYFLLQVPKAGENFIRLCKKNYYDGTIFHRSIRNFMVRTWAAQKGSCPPAAEEEPVIYQLCLWHAGIWPHVFNPSVSHEHASIHHRSGKQMARLGELLKGAAAVVRAGTEQRWSLIFLPSRGGNAPFWTKLLFWPSGCGGSNPYFHRRRHPCALNGTLGVKRWGTAGAWTSYITSNWKTQLR